MIKIVMLCLSLCLSVGLFGQNKVSGIVFDALTNNVLAKAKVEMNGKSVLTNEKGEFSIECSQSQLLTVSLDGFKKFSEKVNTCDKFLNIGLVSLAQNIEEIDITATSNVDKSMLNQPLSIDKLDKKEITRGTGLYLNDAINTNVPGVYMSSRANSSGQQFNIRGYGNGARGTNGLNSNFDGQGSKVYLNGIPVTDAVGITVMDDIDFGSIDQVEISKGPSGTLYGLAIAGVVNLQTRKAAKNTTAIGQDVLLGSYGLMRTTTRLEIGGKNSSVMVNYGHQEFGGFMPHTAAKKNFANFMGDFTLNERQKITTYVGFSDSYDERNGELTITQYENLDYSGNPNYIKNDAHSAVKSFRAGLGHSYKFNKNISNTTSIFGTGQALDNSSAGGWADKNTFNVGLRSTLDMNFKVSEKVSLTGITGIELQKLQANAQFFKMGADSTNLGGYNTIQSMRSDAVTSSATASYFTQWTLNLPKDFSITAGVGYSSMNLKLEDRLWGLTNNHLGNSIPKSYEKNYGNMWSPNLALNKKINKNLSVYASYSMGYKAPTSSYFYIPTTGQVNSDLKPEKGVQFEIGTKGSLLKNKLFYTVALFNAQFKDKMTTISVQNPANTVTLYSYMTNGGTLNNSGLEVMAKYSVIEKETGFFTLVRPFVNLTYSDFNYKDFRYGQIGKTAANKDTAIVNDFSGNTVAGVPKMVFNLGIDAETKIGLYGNVTFNYRDAMYFTSDNLNETKSYALLNGKIGYRKQISKFTLDVYAAANNITSTQYYYMVFVNQLPDAYIPAANKINYFGGISLKYKF